MMFTFEYRCIDNKYMNLLQVTLLVITPYYNTNNIILSIIILYIVLYNIFNKSNLHS